MFTIDYTIHISDVAMVGAGILAFFKMFLSQRDLNRKVLWMLIGEEGKNGLVGDVKAIKRDMYDSAGAVPRMRESMRMLRVVLAARGIENRDEDQP